VPGLLVHDSEIGRAKEIDYRRDARLIVLVRLKQGKMGAGRSAKQNEFTFVDAILLYVPGNKIKRFFLCLLPGSEKDCCH
jgi:hypothetical protein